MEVGISQSSIDPGERERSRRIGLVVRRLGLCLAHEDVGRIEQLILVESVMFTGGADKPDPLAFNQDTTSGKDADLGVVEVFDVVIGNPEPVVLHVKIARFLGGVKAQPCCGAFGIRMDKGVRGLDAVSELQARSCKATDACVDVPQTRRGHFGEGRAGTSWSIEVVLDQHSARCSSLSRHNDVAEFHAASLSWVSNLNDSLRGVDV